MFKTEYKSDFTPFRYHSEYKVLDLLRNTKTIIQDSKSYNSYMINYNTKLNQQRRLNETLIALPKPNETFYKDDRCLTAYKCTSILFKKSKLSFSTTLASYTSNNPISIFYTQADIFNDYSYVNLTYDFNKIYRTDDYYVRMLRQQIEEFKKARNENFTTMLEKRYSELSYTSDGKVVSMYSLEVKFNSINNPTLGLSIFLPFALLPIYYYVDAETFKLLLMSVLKFNESYTELTLDENALYTVLNTWVEYDTNIPVKGLVGNTNVRKFYWLTQKGIFDVYIK
jgi:hypothetical protein